MYIAALTETPEKNAKIAPSFSSAEHLLIFHAETSELKASYPRAGMTDCEIAEEIVNHDCEAVICGPIEEAPFTIIADEGCVTRYNGVGIRADDAIIKMEAYQLDLITDHIGGNGCGSGDESNCEHDHHHGDE